MTFFIENIEVFGVEQALASVANGVRICQTKKPQQNQRSKSSKPSNPYGGVSLLARTSRLGLAALNGCQISEEFSPIDDVEIDGQVVDGIGQIGFAAKLALPTMKNGA
jgi:hypothetical protein